MTNPTRDKWAEWILHRRFGGNPQQGKNMVERLSKIRNHVLEQARIREGESVLDVGCGDGLIAFGALDYVGVRGKVIYRSLCYISKQTIFKKFSRSDVNLLNSALKTNMLLCVRIVCLKIKGRNP